MFCQIPHLDHLVAMETAGLGWTFETDDELSWRLSAGGAFVKTWSRDHILSFLG